MDDTAEYSMACHIRLWFDGELVQEVFTRALEAALKAHPFMRVKLRRSAGLFGIETMFFDEVPVNAQQALDWNDFDKPIEPKLFNGNDLRTTFHVRASKEHAILVVRFHHATSDGQGVYSFLDDLFITYDAIVHGKQIPKIQRDNRLLVKRFNFGMTGMMWLKRLHLDIRRFLKFITGFPTPMAASRTKILDKPASISANLRVVIPNSSLAIFKQTAKKLDASFNDLLVARLFKRLALWNKTISGSARPGTIFRMNVPISMRDKSDDLLPATNYVSMVFLDRSNNQILDETNLVKSITSEMQHIKNDKMGFTLVRSVKAMTKISFLDKFLRLPICMASIGLTNLGRPFNDSKLMGKDGVLRIGNAILSGLDTLPPVRNLTRATVSVNRFNENLSITLRWDSRSIDLEQARQFLSGYVEMITEPAVFGLLSSNLAVAPHSLSVPNWETVQT